MTLTATPRTLARRRASARRRRDWQRRFLRPDRPCQQCGCTVASHREARQGSSCGWPCTCWGLLTDVRSPGGRRPRRAPASTYLTVTQLEDLRREVADLERSVARWRRGLVASYVWRARREFREDDALASVGEVDYERAFLADLLARLRRARERLALGGYLT